MKTATPGTRRHAKRKPTPGQELRATAYHEAGHAIAFCFHGVRFKVASIIPNESEGILGHAAVRLPRWFSADIECSRSARHRFLAERHIVMLLAGAVAESRHLRRPIRTGMESDYHAAVDFTDPFFSSPRTVNAFLHFAQCQAEDLIGTHWASVANVARALLRQKELTYDEVFAVISRGPNR
jgi:hypothetical protein